MLNKFNSWYDRLPGTPRFLLFISVMAAAIFPMQIGLQIGKPWMALWGLALFSIMGFVACVRATNMKGMHKIVGAILAVLMCVFIGMTLIVAFR